MKGILLFVFVILVTGCKDKEEPEPKPIDPLQNAAGTYVGNYSEDGKVTPNVKANVVTEDDGSGRLYIKSVGLSAANFLWVYTRGYYPKMNNKEYRINSIDVSNGILNISGRYSTNFNNPSSPIMDFGFTGTKQ